MLDRRIRTAAASAACFLALLAPATASAEPLVAVDNAVTVTPLTGQPGVARVVAEHRFKVTASVDHHDLSLGRMRGAVVDMAFKVGRRGWKRAEGLAPAAARDRFDARTGHAEGGDGPLLPAVLVSWSHGPSVTFGALDANTTVILRLTYEVHGQLRDGRWGFVFKPGTGLTNKQVSGRRVTAEPHKGRCGSDEGLWISWPGPKRPSMSVLARTTRLPSVSEAGAKHLTMASFQAHARLRALPRGLTIALMVDASRSAVQRHQGAQLDLARATIKAHPEALFTVFAFHRDVLPITSGAVRPAQALAALERFRFPTMANGSEVGKAVRRAARALRPAGAAGRIIVISDGRVRSSLDPSAEGRAARTDNRRLDAVHLVLVEGSTSEWEEVSSHALDPLLEGHGGVVVSAGTGTTGSELAAALKYPTHAHGLALELDGQPSSELLLAKGSAPSRLKAGEGSDVLWLTSTTRPRRLTMTGIVWRRTETWSTPVAKQPRRVARTALGRFESLDAKLVAGLAADAVAVSPARSLLASYGTRPATPRGAGLLRGLSMSGSFSTCCGFGHPISGMGRLRARQLIGPADHVASVLAQTGAANCPGTRDAHFNVALETTDDEIVEVTLTSTVLDAKQRSCLAEQAWKVALPVGTANGRQTTQTRARVAAQ